MAVGFNPKYVEDFHLTDMNQEQFLVLALEAARQLKWEVVYISETGLIAHTNKGMFSWNAGISIKIEHGIANLKSASTGNEMMDFGKNKKTIIAFIDTVYELKPAFSNEELTLKYEDLKLNFPGTQEDILKQPPIKDDTAGFFYLFVPKRDYFITPILLLSNIAIFIIMVANGVDIMTPGTESLLKWGANFKPLTLEGEWWRLITNCFLHIGVLHLLMNMYALMYIGFLLEPYLGKARFFTAYMLAGIVASLTSLWWHDLTVSAGASGAIFGMYGVFLAMLTTNLIEKTARKPLLASICIFVVYNLANGMKGGIDNAAHIGGLVSGLFIGYAFVPSLKKPETPGLKFVTAGLMTMLILVSSFFVYRILPNDIGKYEERIKTFTTNESMALEIYRSMDSTPMEQMLIEIKERGIYYWNENIKLLKELESLDPPDVIKTSNKKLKVYCELRIRSYELMYNAMKENTDRYNSQIEDYDKQIESVLKDLGAEQKEEV